MVQNQDVDVLVATYKQQHLLNYVSELNEVEKKKLIDDIKSVNYGTLCKKEYFSDQERESIDNLLEPLDSSIHQSIARTSKEEIQHFRQKGLKAISEGKVAALLLAGGQGTRLGSSLPKGMFDVGLPSHKTLYQIQAERIVKLEECAQQATGKTSNIPWYIMTSDATIEPTLEFFKKNDYFSLKQENVVVFEQNTIPCFDLNGKILLDQPFKLARAPNGNGGLYEALRQQGILADMKQRGIEHVHVYCVDNILVKVADPVFIGYCISKGAECAAKVVEKVLPSEAVGIICKVKGKFKVVEYSEVSLQTAQKRNPDGRLLFNAGNICNHYFTLDFLTNKVKDDQLKYHIAKKKIAHIDKNGVRVKPDKPNGIKLEKFVFDVFEFASKFAVWEVLREDEFSPLKNSDDCDKDTPTTSRLSLYNLHQRYVLNAGGKFVDEHGVSLPLIPSHVDNQVVCEISPLTSYDGENLEQLVKGKTFQSPLCL